MFCTNVAVVFLELTMDQLVAQCFVFFAAGFETSSSVMSYCFYELALHQDIQERLRKEVESVSNKHGGITYQALLEMPYLEQVVFGKCSRFINCYYFQVIICKYRENSVDITQKCDNICVKSFLKKKIYIYIYPFSYIYILSNHEKNILCIFFFLYLYILSFKKDR